MLIETGRFVLLLTVLLFYMDTFCLDIHIPSTFINYSLSLSQSLTHFLGAVFGQTVTCSNRQDSMVCPGAVGTQDGNIERLRLHSSTAHALLLHSGPLQRVHGLTLTFALTDRPTDGQHPRERQRGWDGEGPYCDFIQLCRLILEGKKH